MSSATPPAPRSSHRPPFSEEVLLAATLEGIETGRSLISWWRARHADVLSRTMPLVRPEGSLTGMDRFYGHIDPGASSVMGCLQRARFAVELEHEAGKALVDGLPRLFASHCSWTRPNGDPGGFRYAALCCLPKGSATPVPSSPGPVSFELGLLEWQVLRVDIHDFVRAIPAMRPVSRRMCRYIREAALIAVIPELTEPLIPDDREKVAEIAFGYAFLPLAPEPNIFGFGPGHFRSAIKQFHYVLLPDQTLEIRLAFIVSPRSEKILNLGGFDPVYSAVEVADRLTFRKLGLAGRFHDRMDAIMLRLHGQVHQNLLQDMEQIWRTCGLGDSKDPHPRS